MQAGEWASYKWQEWAHSLSKYPQASRRKIEDIQEDPTTQFAQDQKVLLL